MSKSRYTKIKDLRFDSYFIDCPVEIEKGALLLDNEMSLVLLQLRLMNIGKAIVSSVYLSVESFDDAGDLIPKVNSVEHTYLDLEVANKASFGEKKPILLDQRVRNVKVTITKVTMKDGEVWRNKGAKEFTSPNQESIKVLGTELVNQLNREANLLSTIQSDIILFIPKQIEGMWVCSCGRANCNDSEICCRCGLHKTWIFQNIEKSYLTTKLSEYNEKLRIASQKQKIIDEEVAKNQMEKDILLNEIKVKENAEKTRRNKKYKIID